MAVAAEEVHAALRAVGDRGDRSEHRVDDGRLVAARLGVASDPDLGKPDAPGLLEEVGDVLQGGVERGERRLGLREVPQALLAALDDVVEDGDGRGADGVLGGPHEGAPGGELRLEPDELAVRRLDAAKRNS